MYRHIKEISKIKSLSKVSASTCDCHSVYAPRHWFLWKLISLISGTWLEEWIHPKDCLIDIQLGCELQGRNTWFTSFSYSSHHSLSPCALWTGSLSFRKYLFLNCFSPEKAQRLTSALRNPAWKKGMCMNRCRWCNLWNLYTGPCIYLKNKLL